MKIQSLMDWRLENPGPSVQMVGGTDDTTSRGPCEKAQQRFSVRTHMSHQACGKAVTYGVSIMALV